MKGFLGGVCYLSCRSNIQEMDGHMVLEVSKSLQSVPLFKLRRSARFSSYLMCRISLSCLWRLSSVDVRFSDYYFFVCFWLFRMPNAETDWYQMATNNTRC